MAGCDICQRIVPPLGRDLFSTFKLQMERVIDVGIFGEIVLVRPAQSRDHMHVVKMFTLPCERREDNRKVFQAEVKFMLSFDHPHLMKLLCAFKCDEYLAICMRYYEKGTLESHVGKFCPLLSERCVTQVACALRYMHKKHIVHRDVKLSNIFIDSDFNAVLGDFGFTEKVHPSQETVHGQDCGSTAPCSTEDWRKVKGNTQMDPYKLDTYYLGVVLWALTLGRNPYECINYYIEVMTHDNLPTHVRNWLLKLLDPHQSNRPTITDFLSVMKQEGSFACIINDC